MALGIYDASATPPGFYSGCSVSSSAARRSAEVTFVAIASASTSAAAEAAATGLTQSTMNNHVSTAKTSLGPAYASLDVSVQDVASPVFAAAPGSTTSPSSSSSSASSVMVFVLVGVGAVVFLLLLGAAAVMVKRRS